MSFSFSEKYLKPFISDKELNAMAAEAAAAQRTVFEKTGAGSDFIGWYDLPDKKGNAEYDRIIAAAERIRRDCDIFLVIGIGGSYLGARAAIEFLYGQYHNRTRKNVPEIYFIGNDISEDHLSEILTICDGKDVCVNVISKSGTTTEPALAFRLVWNMLVKKYGKSASERIYVTTDAKKGALRTMAEKYGYESFVITDDVGGRYSVLSPVGLLPIAVAGADIGKMLDGAAAAKKKFSTFDFSENEVMRYAALRNWFYRHDKSMELLTVNEPALTMFCEWFKQLFGESEGKDGKGLYPSSAVYTTDLHSLGQFIQQGTRIMFESVINYAPKGKMTVPSDKENFDNLNYMAGKEVAYVTQKAFLGTVLAHTDGDVPNIVFTLTERSEFDFGFMAFFFEQACAVSGYMLGINPFNQPGVEAYKKNMFALLGKPGYESDLDALNEKMKDLS